jgi:coenzyme Q-binding protein COQ10
MKIMFVRPFARIRLPRYQVYASRRSLFGLSGPSFIPPFLAPETQTYHERKILPCVGGRATLPYLQHKILIHCVYRYSQKQLYEVVSNVTTYPQFVPFCTGSHILRPLTPEPDSKHLSMDAELTVGFLSFKESYVSKVTCLPYESVEVSRLYILFFDEMCDPC